MVTQEPRVVAVVVPTCRPESLRTFLAAWDGLFNKHDVELVIVRDEPATWALLPPFVPHHTGAIRSLGFLEAWRKGWDVVTLDDDCLPAEGVDLFDEYEAASAVKWPVGPYLDIGHTFGLGEYMRGYPFSHRDVASPALQYGGWDNVPDLDAVTQAENPLSGCHFDRRAVAVPTGSAFTGCIMNVAIAHDALPMMYQLVMGVERVGFDRWDDIWSGLFAKRICDHLRLPVLVNGRASVVHTRASDTASNLAKEQNGYGLNEEMWEHLSTVTLTGNDTLECYGELTNQLDPAWFGPEGQKITDGMKGWLAAL